jgi:hypothetical protein
MPDKEKIKRILHSRIRPGKQVSEGQLSEAAEKVAQLPEISENSLRKIASDITGDPTTFIVGVVDVGDINNELKR